MTKPNKYLVNIAAAQGLDKQASLTGMLAWHIGQNAATKAILKNPKYGKRLADSFQQGIAGIHEGSLKRKLTSAVTSVVSPEAEILYRRMNRAGQDIGPYLTALPKRAKVGLRQLSEGRFHDFDKLRHRMGLSPGNEQHFNKVLDRVQKHTKIPVQAVVNAPSSVKSQLSKTWASKEHPLLSNVLSKVSRGSASASRPVPSTMRQTSPALTQVATAAVDAPGAVVNAVKSSTLIDKVNKSPVIGPALRKVEHHFTVHQAKTGAKEKSLTKYTGGLANAVSENVVNPVSHSIKRTSSSLSNLLERAKLVDKAKT